MEDIQSMKLRFGIIGNSNLLNLEIEKAIRIAPTDLSVLIIGESGVGKEFFPQIIHQNSIRKHGPYIAVNCGAIPEGTIDSELFGHEKGSFTGALTDRKGYFEVANKGTIFLDEVGELPLATQARLLRVLENGEFIRVGSSKVQKTDVRIVAATNLDMMKAIREGKFREDLYYRLNTVPINVPPLRDRREDIPILFRKFASDFAEKYRMPTITLTDEARLLLVKYRWFGNIRELKNITERISIIEQEREITADVLKKYLTNPNVEQLPAVFQTANTTDRTFNNEREILYQVLFDMRNDINELKKRLDMPAASNPAKSTVPAVVEPPAFPVTPLVQTTHPEEDIFPTDYEEVRYAEEEEDAKPKETEMLPLSLEEVERRMIKQALERHSGKRRNAAQDLKISERTLYRKIKEYGLE